MALRFLGADGGYTSDAVRALNYAIGMGVPISSNSWGGGNGASAAMIAALDAAQAAGHLFIAAAGNEANNNDVNPMYPCSYTTANVICVAATTSYDSLASYSNYGVTVHMAAPGSEIYSTYIAPALYRSVSGTSMACPHVAGAAALIWSAFNHLSHADVKRLLLASAAPQTWLTNQVQTGLLDVAALVSHAEASSWLWLLSPAGSSSKDEVASMTLNVAAGSIAVASLQIGRMSMTVGSYTASVIQTKQQIFPRHQFHPLCPVGLFLASLTAVCLETR